jgi:hypothetical protein
MGCTFAPNADRAPIAVSILHLSLLPRDAVSSACHARGGPRALNGEWPKEAISKAANDHDLIRAKEFGATTVGAVGMKTVLARLMVAQTAQRSPTRPLGDFFTGADATE